MSFDMYLPRIRRGVIGPRTPKGFIHEIWVTMASAITVDTRKQKYLFVAAGEHRFQVRWRPQHPSRKFWSGLFYETLFMGVPCRGPEWKVAIDTVDLDGAIAIYNAEEFTLK